MLHDGDGNDCSYYDGLMGGNSGKFSNCSIDYVRNYWNSTDMSCLSNTISLNNTEYEPKCGNNYVEYNEECDCGSETECNSITGNECCNPNTCKVKNSTCQWCHHDYDCIEFDNFVSHMNGHYIYQGCWNDSGILRGWYLKYDTNDYHLWFNGGYWILGLGFGGGFWRAYCRQDSIELCNYYNGWVIWDWDENAWLAQPSDAYIGSCRFNDTCGNNYVDYGESCDCGNETQCNSIPGNECCDYNTCQVKNENSTCPWCHHDYECIEFNEFDSSLDGQYGYQGCFNESGILRAWYLKHDTNDRYLWYNGGKWIIGLNFITGYWRAYCSYSTIESCNDVWCIHFVFLIFLFSFFVKSLLLFSFSNYFFFSLHSLRITARE